MINFVADWEASAINHTHSVQIAQKSSHLNVPPNRTDAASEIVHGSVVSDRGSFTGFLFRTRMNDFWYQDGLIAKEPRDRAKSAAVVGLLGMKIRKVGVGSFTRIDPSSLGMLLNGDISVTACF